MKVKKAELTCVAAKKEQYPKERLYEIALAGRSNVGKSSFINALVNRTKLARISGNPGKTQTINFYTINDKFRLVDLPGYGYAKVSKLDREKWGQMIEEYLYFSKNLKEVLLFLDIRREPNKYDIIMYNWIKDCGYNGIIILTKADKLSKNQRIKQIKMIKNKLNVQNKNFIIPFSAKQKMNVDEVWKIIDKL